MTLTLADIEILRKRKRGFMGRIVRRWTDDDFETARRMFDGGKNHEEIASRLGRTVKAVREKLKSYRAGSKGQADQLVHVPAEVLEDCERRRHLDPRDLTAALCGDPLPGRSALDRGTRV